jgi:hypothetical protein
METYLRKDYFMSKRPKHVSFAKQREWCRLNKHTYTEKCGNCKTPILMCNYPFINPDHKKGFCKASTCTDMREIAETPEEEVPQAILDAEKEEAEMADKQEGQTEALNTDSGNNGHEQ